MVAGPRAGKDGTPEMRRSDDAKTVAHMLVPKEEQDRLRKLKDELIKKTGESYGKPSRPTTRYQV